MFRLSVAKSPLYMFGSILIGIYIGIHISGMHYHDFLSDHYNNNNNNNIHNNDYEHSFGQDNNSLFKDIQKVRRELGQWKMEAESISMDHSKLQNQLYQLQNQQQQKQQQNQQTNCKNDNDNNNNNNIKKTTTTSLNNNLHPMCQQLLVSTSSSTSSSSTSSSSFMIPSTNSLWYQHLHQIFKASKLPDDIKYSFHDFTAQLLQIVSPRLVKSIKSLPYDWDTVERVMTIAWERYKYIHSHNNQQQQQQSSLSTPPPPRPLKILVMGGSLLVGRNCRKVMKELSLKFQLPLRNCTWGNRLGRFLDLFFSPSDDNTNIDTGGGDDSSLVIYENSIVQVTKVAMGGTNTATGNIIFQYDLIPEEARDPDIVINAYSTNDMHILTILEAESSNTTLRDRVLEMTQDFVRQLQQHHHHHSSSSTSSCDKNNNDNGSSTTSTTSTSTGPLLLHIDDYLGNEQRTIWETTELAQGVQILANYYGFTSISYADMVRDIVYGDTRESWFSANWWESGTFERDIHPGMGMHIASTWVILYNLLNLVVTYCSMNIGSTGSTTTPPPFLLPKNYTIEHYQPGLFGLPPLRNDGVKQAKGKPKGHPKGLPPTLTKELLIEDVTKLWREESVKQQQQQQEEEVHLECHQDETTGEQSSKTTIKSHHHHYKKKCPFAWVGGLSLQQNNETWIKEYFQGRASVWEGWKIDNEGSKIGFVPSTTTKRNIMVLDFTFSQTVRTITMFYMKSYGTKWSDSRIQLSILLPSSSTITSTTNYNILNQTLLAERSLVGYHAKNTSEMYTEEIPLPQPISMGRKFHVQAKLTGGTTFKIMGLAVCS